MMMFPGGASISFASSHRDGSGASPSPCIDTGDSRLAVGLLDVERHPRIADCKVDMGAYEYAVAPPECPGPGLCPCIDEADIRAAKRFEWWEARYREAKVEIKDERFKDAWPPKSNE